MITLSSAITADESMKVPVQKFKPKAVDEGPVIVEFGLLPKQHEFVTSPDHTVALIGGIGSGKTRALMTDAGLCLYRERNRGTVGGIFANTYKQLGQSTLPQLWQFFEAVGFVYGRDYVYNEAPPRGWRGFTSKFLKDHGSVLSVRWWGQAVVRSMENVDSIRGIEIGWAHIDEARDASQEDYNVVVGRVRCPKASRLTVRIATSPNGYDWMYDALVDRPNSPVKLITVSTYENPFLPNEYIKSLEATYDPRFAEQELGGKFVALGQGRAYHQFDRNVHVDKSPDYCIPDADWIVSFDFNRNPFCVVLMQCVYQGQVGDKRNALVVAVDEVVMQDVDTTQACTEVIRRIAPTIKRDKPVRVTVYGDPSGRNRTTKSNQSDYDIIDASFSAAFGPLYEKRVAYSDPGQIARINALNGLLRNSAKQVRFKVNQRCKYLIRDLERVSFKPGTRELDKTNKQLTHLSDGACYYCAEEFPVIGLPSAANFHV